MHSKTFSPLSCSRLMNGLLQLFANILAGQQEVSLKKIIVEVYIAAVSLLVFIMLSK